MHVISFVNKPDEVSPHSNEYAEGTVSVRSFSERKEIDQSRTAIGSYMQSQIGTSYIDRSVLRKPKPRIVNVASGKNSRQEVNSRSLTRTNSPSRHTFREPPSRGYNPYS